MATAIAETDPEKPTCECCGGTGSHTYRPHVSPSPDDDDEECSLCHGSGQTWFDFPKSSCSGARELSRRNHGRY